MQLSISNATVLFQFFPHTLVSLTFKFPRWMDGKKPTMKPNHASQRRRRVHEGFKRGKGTHDNDTLTSNRRSRIKSSFFAHRKRQNLRVGIPLIYILCLLSWLAYNKHQFHHPTHGYGPTTSKTGSWASCHEPSLRTKLLQSWNRQTNAAFQHDDSAFTILSCTNLHYRIPQLLLQELKKSTPSLIIGVLSGASGDGPQRRSSIRNTWANNQTNVLFLVAGPWEDIEREYMHHGDLLWIDMEEIYITETSVLTYKTESFLSILYHRVVQSTESVQYLFKTDDDSYVALEKLHEVLLDEPSNEKEGSSESETASLDYWGKCREGAKPHRTQEVEWQKKWYISYDTYPEPEYPTYCQGAVRF